MSSQLSASLLRLKLLDALRSGDNLKVENIINELTLTKATIQTTDLIHLKETILHYAVQVAPLTIIQFLVQNSEKFGIDVNAQDPDGNTPLHLAAASSRFEIVKYLLSLPQINDTITNLKKKQPVELCKDLNIAQLMQFERAKFVEKSATQLRQHFSNKDFENLEKLLVSNPRASELLDINGADPETGNTVLHEFIKKDDIEMCDWILKHGGDPFKRDKRGKLPIDLIPNKNDRLRKLLKSASKDQNIMDPVVSTSNVIKSGGAPTYKGYLRKWTNFASGYKLRYFVLDQNGVLSYYTNQDDTNNACRGSLNLSFATLHLDSSEKLKFEIFGKNGIRWHLKANHPIETNRWVWTLQNAITIAKDNLKKKNPGSSNESRIDTSSSPKKQSIEEPEARKYRHFQMPGRRKHKRNSSQISISSNASANNEDEINSTCSNPPSRSSTFSRKLNNSLPNLAQIQEKKFLGSRTRFSSEDQYSYPESDLDNFDYDIEDLELYGDYDSDSDSAYRRSSNELVIGPLGDQVSMTKRSLDVEITSLLDLFNQAAKVSDKNSEICSVGLNTLKVIQELFAKYNNLVQTRDQRILSKLERQLEINKLWESSIHQLENEIAKREEKLVEFEGQKKQLRKYLASTGTKSDHLTPSTNIGTITPKDLGNSSVVALSGTLPEMSKNEQNMVKNEDDNNKLEENTGPACDSFIEEIFNDVSDDEFFDADEFEEKEVKEERLLESEEVNEEKNKGIERYITAKVSDSNVRTVSVALIKSDDSSEITKVEGEHAATKTPSPHISTEAQRLKFEKINEEGSYLGYDNPPRKKLSMDEDNRPKMSLWGILKSMIGKDMTKMTLPVSFNEPTSLLQRLTEDIEYSHLLDKAASYDDSTLRLVYVTAFAASEYASTTNRIAKPFNPLLGETFEYCRPDQNYRLITEQVSHHPPISACSAESIKWDYYGENAVDSQLRVRSFDFKHLGKMFCIVRPDNGVIDINGNKVDEELYSWKKVNTSVVGIILGNPQVDNYGKMEVTNHTTGDVIVVDLKQRGWKASSAYQLSGLVLDKYGKSHWAIGGHWNSKIFGKKIREHHTNPQDGTKRRNSLVEAEIIPNKTSHDPFSGGKFLVWQAAPRPKIPFNLTSFATTLNGIDDNLKAWLPPTDTRLRPDQRAMEDGRYDEASEEKHRVEEKQRAARKRREQKKEIYQPNWFVRKKHPITGDNYWEFKGDYWKMRKEHKLEGCGDIF